MISIPSRASVDGLCRVCGNIGWTDRKVLCPILVGEWGLSPDETDYVDRQQGTSCSVCGANLRSMALAEAIKLHLGGTGSLASVLAANPHVRILEINEAGNLTPTLRSHPQYTFAAYPAVDMQALPYGTGTLNLVVHSDTLEHVADPVRGLRECRRVLAPGGACIYTIPIIIDRLSRRRDGLPPSFHGTIGTPEYLVVTEYGADAWLQCLAAGFSRVTLNTVDFPSAIAITCLP